MIRPGVDVPLGGTQEWHFVPCSQFSILHFWPVPSASGHWFLISPFSCESPYIPVTSWSSWHKLNRLNCLCLGDSSVRFAGSNILSLPFQCIRVGAICARDVLGGLTGWPIKIKELMYSIHVEGSTSSSVCLYIQIRCVTINQCIQFLRRCWRYLGAAGIKQRFYRSFISKHCKWSTRQWNVQDSFWLSGLQLLKPLWTELGLPGALQSISSLISAAGPRAFIPLMKWLVPSAPAAPRVRCFSHSIESQARCNYWNKTTLKYLGKQHWFGINHNFNLTESDHAPLAVISPLPTHAWSLLQGVWGKWDVQPALPGKSLFKWSATDLVGILGSKRGFLENEIAPGTGKSIQRFKEVAWAWGHLGGNRYFLS